jgi:hypothetical protein
MGRVKELMKEFRAIWADDHTSAHINTSTNTISIPSVPSITTTELNELETLTKNSHEDNRTAKLAAFKQLPRELRQYAVTQCQWLEAVEKINNITSHNQRLDELQLKAIRAGKWDAGAPRDPFNRFSYDFYTSAKHRTEPNYIPMPNELSSKDLTKAHLEACLEEELADGA